MGDRITFTDELEDGHRFIALVYVAEVDDKPEVYQAVFWTDKAHTSGDHYTLSHLQVQKIIEALRTQADLLEARVELDAELEELFPD